MNRWHTKIIAYLGGALLLSFGFSLMQPEYNPFETTIVWLITSTLLWVMNPLEDQEILEATPIG